MKRHVHVWTADEKRGERCTACGAWCKRDRKGRIEDFEDVSYAERVRGVGQG